MDGTCQVICTEWWNLPIAPTDICGKPGVVYVNEWRGPTIPAREQYVCAQHYRWIFCCAECGEPKESIEGYFCRRCAWEADTRDTPAPGW
jgi:hypothetical protein